MGGLSIWHLLIIALLFVLLFGKGKISDLMGDVAKGVKSFKQGMADDEPESAPEEAPSKPVARAPRKPRAKAAAKPRLAIEDKTAQKTVTAARKRKTTTKS